MQQLQAAAARFDCALVYQPASIAALNGRALTADLAGERGAAKALFLQALALAPDDAMVSNNLSLLYLSAGEHDQAIALLQRFSGESHKPQLLNLALAYLINQEPDTARWVIAQNFQAEQTELILQRLLSAYDRILHGEPVRQVLLAMSRSPMLVASK